MWQPNPRLLQESARSQLSQRTTDRITTRLKQTRIKLLVLLVDGVEVGR
jgi:hypothetical protein